jgi:CheY-like chemotaxis protein
MTQNKTQPVLLIVDDEPELRDILATEFNFRGYRTIQKGSGTEAIELLKLHRVDAIVTDLRMKDGNGLDILRFVKAHVKSPPPVIVLSALLELPEPELRDLGAHAVFLKPFAIESLCSAVTAALSPDRGREGRRHRRIPVSLAVEVQVSSDEPRSQARVLNVSEGGMFIAPNSFAPSIGDEIHFCVEIPFRPILKMEGSGIVRWVQPDRKSQLPSGFGIEFLPMKHFSDEVLKRLLKCLAPLVNDSPASTNKVPSPAKKGKEGKEGGPWL